MQRIADRLARSLDRLLSSSGGDSNSPKIDAQATASPATAGSLAAKMDTMLTRLPSPGVSAVQYGSTSMVSVATITATISTVDVTKSAVIWLGDYSLNAPTDKARLTLTNATTVTANRDSTTSSPTNTNFMVVTFVSVVSLQQGTTTITLANASGTTTVSSVATGRAALFYGGQQMAAALADRDTAQIYLTNATTITATRFNNGASGTGTIAWTLVEF